MQPALVTTVHDPEGRLLDAVGKHRARLADYDGVYLRCTSNTSRHLVRELDQVGEVTVEAPGMIGRSRREALRSAQNAGAANFLYCDFDRWLHWAGSYPQELTGLPGSIQRDGATAWYVCLGRTDQAFATHPNVQRWTEDISNRIISRLVGRTLDATAGACWLSPTGAEIVLSESTELTNATDLEWPSLIAVKAIDRLAYLATDGLEFETATFHAREIEQAGGRDAWIDSRYDVAEVWESRTNLMHCSIQAAVRVFSASRGGPTPGTDDWDERLVIG